MLLPIPKIRQQRSAAAKAFTAQLVWITRGYSPPPTLPRLSFLDPSRRFDFEIEAELKAKKKSLPKRAPGRDGEASPRVVTDVFGVPELRLSGRTKTAFFEMREAA